MIAKFQPIGFIKKTKDVCGSWFLTFYSRSDQLEIVCLYPSIHQVALPNLQGRTCRGVLATWDRLFTKMISQRDHATEAQTYISVHMVDAPYFYRHCLSYYISILIVFYNSCY